MPTFLFRCPYTGLNVQDWVADDATADHAAYHAVTCTACARVHFVDPKTGKVLGGKRDSGTRRSAGPRADE